MSTVRSVRAWAQLLVGLLAFGIAISLMVQSRLGLGPWDAFHAGLHRLTGMSLGMATVVTGVVILVGSFFLGIRPGWGTIANMVLIGIFIDLLLPWMPPAQGAIWGLTYYAPAILLCGLATGVYIAAGLGKGPRDGLMIGLSVRSGWPVRRVRTLIELVVLLLGWTMGGRVGVGTLLFAFGIGPATQWGLAIFGAQEGFPSEAPSMEPAT